MLPLYKKIITSLVLASLMTIIFFSLTVMTHGSDGRMSGDCPFSAGVSFCPQDTLAVVIHHISAYQSFLNVTITSGIMTLLISLFLLVLATFVLSIGPPLSGLLLPISIYDFPPASSHDRKIKRWLSLFENSPSEY